MNPEAQDVDEDVPPETCHLPVWFTKRMMTDDWSFGLLMMTGHLLCISSIRSIARVASGALWLDVALLDRGTMSHLQATPSVRRALPAVHWLGAPTERVFATVRASHIMAAFELADT